MRISRATPFDIAPDVTDSLIVSLEPRTELVAAGDLQILSNDPTAPDLRISVTSDIRALDVETNALTGEVEIPLGQALTIQVIPAPGVHVERGALFHRPASPESAFVRVELAQVGSSFIGVIPNEAVTELGLEYYIEVENSGVFLKDPPGAPDSALFTQAVVSPSGVTATPQAGPGGRFPSGDDITVAIELVDGAVFVDGVLHYRRGGESAYRSVALSTGAPSSTGIVPGEFVGLRGVEYWVEVETATASLTDPPSDPSARPRSVQVTVANLAEPTLHAGSVYRTLSVPLEFDSGEPIEALLTDQGEFGPYDPKRWQAWTYVSETQSYVGVADASAREQMRPIPGRAFWLISRDLHRVNTAPLSGKSTSTEGSHPITLVRDGWTMLGHPFGFPVTWDSVIVGVGSVLDDSLLTGPIRWNPESGEYDAELAQRLEPFEGYWVHNAGTETILRIPPIEAEVAVAQGAGGAAGANERSSPSDWRVGLSAVTSEGAQTQVLVGVHSSAHDAYDRSDRLAPPSSPGPWIRFGVDQERWGNRTGLYWQDLRAPNANGHRFDLAVRSSEVGESRIALSSPSDLPSELHLRLIDLEQKTSVDPLTGEYRLVSFGPNPYRLILLVGTSEFSSREAEAIVPLPSALVLYQNAPNPFRSATRVRFGLPDPGPVLIEIFDIRGARVASLVNARLPVGYHTVVWDGRDDRGRRAAAGVYFYRMKTADRVLTRKMARLR
jgi:hypothetical protein